MTSFNGNKRNARTKDTCVEKGSTNRKKNQRDYDFYKEELACIRRPGKGYDRKDRPPAHPQKTPRTVHERGNPNQRLVRVTVQEGEAGVKLNRRKTEKMHQTAKTWNSDETQEAKYFKEVARRLGEKNFQRRQRWKRVGHQAQSIEAENRGGRTGSLKKETLVKNTKKERLLTSN